ncbi:hypothetical protein BDN72DRAFT_671094 [Pluteus cervinus]|uniref:Uncharacterized protein n=1 Tax=Pluteus cervinus TaxID=181527 RepID=A0ACD3B9D2_9AGAR|nr:hypothetical protein BDN72DRAFT_671094 [Pluteus cervinus]
MLVVPSRCRQPKKSHTSGDHVRNYQRERVEVWYNLPRLVSQNILFEMSMWLRITDAACSFLPLRSSYVHPPPPNTPPQLRSLDLAHNYVELTCSAPNGAGVVQQLGKVSGGENRALTIPG